MKKYFALCFIIAVLTACGGEKEVVLSDTSIPLEERIASAVHTVVGEKVVGKDIDTLSSVKDNDGIVKVEINSNAHEGSKQSLLKESAEIFSNLSKMNDIKTATISWVAPLTDQYGKETMDEVLAIMIDGETFKKVNWDNYESLDLEQIASGYKQHEALNN